MSLILFFIYPSYTLNHEDFFRFKGIFLHAQRFSLILALALLILIVDRNKGLISFFRVFQISLFVLLLLATKTRANTTFIVFIFLFDFLKNQNKFLLVTISVLVLFLTFYVDLFSSISGIYSRESSDVTELTGRTELWSLLMPEINSNIILGHGFGYFKTGPIPVFSWIPTHAHNLWLMQMYETGIIGTVLFTLFLISAFVIAIKHSRIYGFSYLYYYLIFVFLSSLTGLIVGGLVTPLYFVLFIFIFKEMQGVLCYKRMCVKKVVVY